MIKMDSADLATLSKTFNNHKHSYFLLGSIHGYSISEIKVILDTSSEYHYLDTKKEPRVLVSVFDVDQTQKHARIQICAIEILDVNIAGFIKQIKQSYQLQRLYSYVFPDEEIEISCLESAGFIYEAVFRQHIYVDGRYRDLLVYGQLEKTE